MGLGEMIVVAVVALLVFGGRLPEAMHNLGRSYAKFRRGLDEITHPIRQELQRFDVTSPLHAVPQPRRPALARKPAKPPVEPAEGTIATTPRPEATPDTVTGERPAPPPPRSPSPADIGADDEPPPV